MLVLDVLVGGAAVHTVEVGRPVHVGRAPGCELLLMDDTVSALHAVVEPVAGGVRVRDLDSTNGTWVGDARLEAPVVLGAGAHLRVGQRVRLRVRRVADAVVRELFVRVEGGPGLLRLGEGAVALSAQVALHRRGEDAVWLTVGLEDRGAVALDREHVVDGVRFRVHSSPVALPSTAAPSRAAPGVHLAGSLTEVRLWEEGGASCRVRAETRVALLFVLARRWQAEAARSGPERGWADDAEVCAAVWGRERHAHLDNNYNVLLSRVRRALRDAGLDPHVLERRAGQTRLRLRGAELC